MRPFVISALAATLIGCTGVAPKQTQQTSLIGYAAASALQMDLKTKRAIAAKKSAHRHGSKEVSRTKNAKSNTVPNVASSVQPNDKSNTLINGQSSVAAKTEPETAQSSQPAGTSNVSINPESTAIAKTEIPQSSQLDDKLDSVLKKAMPRIAAKMENSVSVELVEMKRAEKNAAGKSVDTICGYVRGKTASGAVTGERPFLYLVQENEAYVGGYNMATSPYHNLCRE
jgi:hypothetical protein